LIREKKLTPPLSLLLPSLYYGFVKALFSLDKALLRLC
jgi:hypothetical protein